MDMRSAYLDTELMLVIRSKDINKQLEEGLMEYEKAVSYTHLLVEVKLSFPLYCIANE